MFGWPKHKDFRVNFDPESLSRLETVSRRMGKDKLHCVKTALSLLDKCTEMQARGYDITLVHPAESLPGIKIQID